MCRGARRSHTAPDATRNASAGPAACQLVRLWDIGWTEVTATISSLLRHIGYQTEVTVVSGHASMNCRDIAGFLGTGCPR